MSKGKKRKKKEQEVDKGSFSKKLLSPAKFPAYIRYPEEPDFQEEGEINESQPLVLPIPVTFKEEVVSLQSIREDFRKAGVRDTSLSKLSEKITEKEIQLTDIDERTAEGIFTILAKALRFISSIESITILSGMKDGEAMMLSGALEFCTNIKELNLSFVNKISVIGIKPILKSLKGHKGFETLNLESNRLSVSGAIEVSKALEEGLRVKNLDLTRNKIGDVGVIVLSKTLGVGGHVIKTLNLTGNEITDIGAIALFKALRACKCNELILTANNISDKGIKALAEMIEAGVQLHKIEIMLNNISEDGAKAILEALKKNDTVTSVLLSGEISKEGGSGYKPITQETQRSIEVEVGRNKSNLLNMAKITRETPYSEFIKTPEKFIDLGFYREADKSLLRTYLNIYLGDRKASEVMFQLDGYIAQKDLIAATLGQGGGSSISEETDSLEGLGIVGGSVVHQEA